MKYICTPPKHKYKGSGLLIMAIVSAAIFGLTAVSLAKVNHLAFSGLNSSQIALQAQQYAEAEASIIKATAYKDLKAHAKTTIQNSNGYQSEVSLSNESDYSDTIKQKTATIKIYRTGENQPRSTLNLLKLSVEKQEGGGVPIGTIITWASSKNPTENGTWLECNGQSASAYPALVAVLGKNTVPDYRGVFLRGYGSVTTNHFGNVVHKSNNLGSIQGDAMIQLPTSYFYAALGRIGSDYASESQQNAFSCSGAFSYISTYNTAMKTGNSDNWGRKYKLDFSGAIPTANEIRPVNIAVRYFIKAA